MQNETPAGSPLPESDEPAPDVTDLATAKRYIAMLRERLAHAAEEAEPLANEIAVFLSDEDAQKAEWLFEQRKLCYAQRDDPELEFFDAFQEFVSEAMDVAYDMYQTIRAATQACGRLRPRRIGLGGGDVPQTTCDQRDSRGTAPTDAPGAKR